MEDLQRVTGKIFASNAAEGDIGQYGSALAGNRFDTDDVATIQALPAYETGWRGAVISTKNYPTLQEMNGLQKSFSYQINYLLQKGVAKWDASTEYYTDDFCSVDNELYVSIADNNINHDPTELDSAYWALYSPGLGTYARQDLTNLTSLGIDRLHALKGYLDEGEALTDTELYDDVHSYANSTFDRSKFTVVGNPTITDNGIASNLSTSNYLNAIPSSMYYNKSNWHLQFKGKFDPSIACGFMDFDNDVYAYLAYMDGWHSIVLQLYDTSNEQIFISIEQAQNKFVEGDILFDIYYSSTNGYYFTATQNGITYTSETSSNTNQLKNASTQPLLYIHSDSTISIDLKTIKFFVDNQPVFDGNISGVDTIGTSYQQAGSTNVTISKNGVASGFSATSYLTHTMNFSGSGFKARIPFKVTATNATQELFYNSNLQFRLLYVSGSTALYPSAYVTDGSHTTQPRTSTYALQANTNYIVEYEFIQGTSLSIKLYAADGVTLLDSLTNTSADTKAVVLPNTNLITYIGVNNTGGASLSGSMDLAGTRIETDAGVYRPFLQIPYVLSSTGSKIVDSAYRDRVFDIYKQEGKALYYTIDYTNKNVTLPMGEVYGFIENRQVIGDWCEESPTTISTATLNRPAVIVENYINSQDGYRVWSDGLIEQWGYKATNVNAQAEYTVSLLKAFSNNNYYFDRSPHWALQPSSTVSSFFDNGYTAKTTTTVTFKMHESSMQNGTDWYACGY